MQLNQATAKIRMALLGGKHMTSAEMNKLGNTVDSRKIISRLRKQFDIHDYWVVHPDRRYKTYYCPGYVLKGKRLN